MNQNSNDPLDSAIDEGARQLVSRDVPERLRAAVLAQIDPNRSRPPIVWSRWGIGLATSAAVAIVAVVLWKTEPPSQREPRPVSQTPSISQQLGTELPRRAADTPPPSTEASPRAVRTRGAFSSLSVSVEPPAVGDAARVVNPINVSQIEPSTIALGSVEVPPIELASLKVNPINSQP